MRTLLFALLSGVVLQAAPGMAHSQSRPDTSQKIIPGRLNSPEQAKKPYIILISADGFRYDLANKYHATHLQALRSKGVEASAMTPAYPSLTFPNHYSIATGLYPAHHGLVANSFYDPQKGKGYRISDRNAVNDSSWYGGTPIWVLAEQQHMLTANFYWVGSEAAVQGVRSTYYYNYNDQISMDDRLKIVRNWLTLPEAKRPHLITFYMPQVDHEEHMHGPDSREAEEAVRLIDNTVGRMAKMVDSLHLPVSFIFLSDHGMALDDTAHTLPLPAEVDTSKFNAPDGEAILNIYAKDKSAVAATYQALKAHPLDYDVYYPTETPARWHYSADDDKYHRLGDIILVPKFPKVFNIRQRKPAVGMHGFDNALTVMQATFYAWGPAFREHYTIGNFENVNVYPLIAKVLGLTPPKDIDGSLSVLEEILR